MVDEPFPSAARMIVNLLASSSFTRRAGARSGSRARCSPKAVKLKLKKPRRNYFFADRGENHFSHADVRDVEFRDRPTRER